MPKLLSQCEESAAVGQRSHNGEIIVESTYVADVRDRLSVRGEFLGKDQGPWVSRISTRAFPYPVLTCAKIDCAAAMPDRAAPSMKPCHS
jgi:hypothetical protein